MREVLIAIGFLLAALLSVWLARKLGIRNDFGED